MMRVNVLKRAATTDKGNRDQENIMSLATKRVIHDSKLQRILACKFEARRESSHIGNEEPRFVRFLESRPSVSRRHLLSRIRVYLQLATQNRT